MALTSKANEMRQNGEDVLVLTVGEPDFDTPQYIKDAAKKAIDGGHTKYTSVDGTLELKKAIISKFKNENNLDYDINEIIVSAGCKQSIFNLLQVIIQDGDEVIIPQPYWVSYSDMVVYSGGIPIMLETSYEENFDIDPSKLENLINDKTKLFMLNSPNNPSGKYFDSLLLKKLGDILLKHKNIYISSDDIYEHITYDKAKFFTIAQISNLKNRTLTMNGVSKSYAMTGWRIGYAGGPKEIIKAIRKVQSQSTSNPSSVSQAAAVEALNGTQKFIKIRSKEFKKRRDFVVKSLNKIKGISCLTPNGAFYVFPSCKDLLNKKTKLKKDTDFVQKLLEKANVAVVQGSDFGLEGYFRISYATSMKNLKKAMERIKSFCESLS